MLVRYGNWWKGLLLASLIRKTVPCEMGHQWSGSLFAHGFPRLCTTAEMCVQGVSQDRVNPRGPCH